MRKVGTVPLILYVMKLQFSLSVQSAEEVGWNPSPRAQAVSTVLYWSFRLVITLV